MPCCLLVSERERVALVTSIILYRQLFCDVFVKIDILGVLLLHFLAYVSMIYTMSCKDDCILDYQPTQ